MPFILLVRCWQALRGWLWCRYVRWPTRIMNPMNLYLQQIGFHVHINKNLGVYWQFKSLPLAFVDVTSCRFHLNFLSIFQYDNQWTSDGPLWQLHEVRSAYSACISTQRHGHEKRLLRTIFGGEKVLETSSMFVIEIPGVVAVTVLTVLRWAGDCWCWRYRLFSSCIDKTKCKIRKESKEFQEIDQVWHGIYCSSCNDSTRTSWKTRSDWWTKATWPHRLSTSRSPHVFNEQRWSILVSVSVLPLTWEWPKFAPKRWRSMAHDGSIAANVRLKSGHKREAHRTPIDFSFLVEIPCLHWSLHHANLHLYGWWIPMHLFYFSTCWLRSRRIAHG